jgi:hypothetical protein
MIFHQFTKITAINLPKVGTKNTAKFWCILVKFVDFLNLRSVRKLRAGEVINLFLLNITKIYGYQL